MALLLLVGMLPAASAGADVTEAAAVSTAARVGDAYAMRRLTGTEITLSGRVVKVRRDTKAYRDYLVLTDERLGLEAEPTLPVVLRIAAGSRFAPAARQVHGAMKVIDFEPYVADRGLRWLPVLRPIEQD